MTSQGVIDLYHFLCGRTNWCNIIAITPCMGIWSFRQEAWKPCLVLALDHNNVNWWWRLYDLKGHSSASNHSQTVRYSKIPLFSKKRTFLGWKLLCWHWLCIRIILGLFIAIIDGLTKNLVGKSCCLFCYDVYQCIVVFEYCLHLMLWGTGNHPSHLL